MRTVLGTTATTTIPDAEPEKGPALAMQVKAAEALMEGLLLMLEDLGDAPAVEEKPRNLKSVLAPKALDKPGEADGHPTGEPPAEIAKFTAERGTQAKISSYAVRAM